MCAIEFTSHSLPSAVQIALQHSRYLGASILATIGDSTEHISPTLRTSHSCYSTENVWDRRAYPDSDAGS
eukprot:3251490-Rhodomonas_salina.1